MVSTPATRHYLDPWINSQTGLGLFVWSLHVFTDFFQHTILVTHGRSRSQTGVSAVSFIHNDPTESSVNRQNTGKRRGNAQSSSRQQDANNR